MEDELGLKDREIGRFFVYEPFVLPECQTERAPDKSVSDRGEAFERSRLIAHILDSSCEGQDGLTIIADRIAASFAERQVEEQAGVIATPSTVR
jgi:hypothetical protein